MEASAASKPPRQGTEYPGPAARDGANLENRSCFRVKLFASPREFPGKWESKGQPENEYIHFLVCPAVFRCTLCAQRASEAGCPEAMDCVIQVTVGSCLLSKLRSIRHWRVQGGTAILVGFGAKPQRIPSPSNFCFSVSCFNQGIVSRICSNMGRSDSFCSVSS